MSKMSTLCIGRKLAFEGLLNFINRTSDFVPREAVATLSDAFSFDDTDDETGDELLHSDILSACQKSSRIANELEYPPVLCGKTRDGFVVQISRYLDGNCTSVSLLVEGGEATLTIASDADEELYEYLDHFDVGDVWESEGIAKQRATRQQSRMGIPSCPYEDGTL